MLAVVIAWLAVALPPVDANGAGIGLGGGRVDGDVQRS